MAKEIPLTQGFVTLVDDEDFEYLSQYKWRYHSGYATRAKHDKASKRQLYIGMHQVVLGRKLGRNLAKGERPDHRDHNTLNNTRDNLRLATQSQNAANARKRPGQSSRFKGVSIHKNTGKWQAKITINRRNTHLGLFSNEEEAARVYDQYALLQFGEFAVTNFPSQN